MKLRELEQLKAKPWQVELLKKNPSYVYWGNFEDYMSGGEGWRSPLEFAHIEDGGLFELDDYNELVHFYFEVARKSKECSHCEGMNLNPATKQLQDDWYSFDKVEWVYLTGGKRYNDLAWQNHLTEVEIEALVKAGRLRDLLEESVHYEEETESWYKWENREKVKASRPNMPTPEQVNEWNQKGMGHDAINQWVAVEARAKHLGVYGECEQCAEHGFDYIEPEAKVSLQLWYLHPRKGASRGVYIKEIFEQDVPKVLALLKEAKKEEIVEKVDTIVEVKEPKKEETVEKKQE